MPIRPRNPLARLPEGPVLLRKIVDAAAVTQDDQVLEIGPGLGHLTRELAAARVVSWWWSWTDRLVPLLRRDVADASNVEIVHADALAFDYGSLAGTWKVVANLPYYISYPADRTASSPSRSKFTTLTLMLQKEVAERIAAGPGGKGLRRAVHHGAAPCRSMHRFTVPPGAFTPSPKVTSAVVTLKVRQQPA